MGIFTVPEEEIARCVALIGEIDSGKDAQEVLDEIRPTILRMRNGRVVFSQIQKLILAGNRERAVKLLRVAPRTRGGVFRFSRIAGPVVIGAAVFLLGPLMPRCDGAYEPAMAALNACPQAVALLGGSITQSSVGMACGSSESSGSHGRSNWRISVKGDRGSGSYEYGGRNLGQGWRLDFAKLTVGDQVVNIWPCSGTATTEALRVAVSITGSVASAEGAAAVQPGAPCTITVSPTPDEARQRGYNCHVRVQCGNAIIYGWEGAGYTSCRVMGGQATSANDPQGASAGDDPMLALDVPNRTCTVSDDGGNAFSVVISLTGGV